MNNKLTAFLIVSITMIIVANKRTVQKGVTAKPGQISIFNNYENMSGLKHDFFKLFCMTFIPGLLISGPINFFDINNFSQSLVGRALIVALTIAFYHTTVQPAVNYLPRF